MGKFEKAADNTYFIPKPGYHAGDYVLLGKGANEEDITNAKEQVVERICAAIRKVAAEHEDFFIIKETPNKDGITVATEFMLPTVHVEKNLTFGQAIQALKWGRKVARAGWNGKGMYLWLKPAATIKKEWCRDPMLIECIEKNGGDILALGTISMYTHDSTGRNSILTGWLASQSDMLCEDWYIVE